MLLDNVRLILHSHLEDNEIFEVRWFPQYLDDADTGKVHDLHCLETRIDELGDDDALYEEAIDIRTRIATRLFDGRLGKTYLVLLEHSQLPRNRIRSYKGLFPYKGKIKQGDYIEFEFELEAGWSFFAGVAPITKDNRGECIALARSSLQAFILITGERSSNVYTHQFLESIIPCLRTKGSIEIDFMKLIPKVCSQHLMIISFCSDINGDYVNIRSFFHAEEKELIEQAMNSAIEEVDRYRGIYQIKPAPSVP